MFRLFSTPNWFNGYDMLFDGITLVIALLIAGYAWKVFRLNKEDKYAYFSLAFISVSISMALKMLTNGVIYSLPVRDTVAHVLSPVTGKSLEYSIVFYSTAFILQIAAMLSAWLLIFLISQKSRSRFKRSYEMMQIGLMVYLVLLISIVSNFKYFVFYLTSSVLLGMIVLNYYKNYLNKDKNRNAFIVLVAFLLILFGNISLIFVFLYNPLYVLGEVLTLMGFLMLLYTYRRVVKS